MKKKLKTNVGVFEEGQDLIDYMGLTVMIGHEFCVYNLGESDIQLQLNEEGDLLTLEPQEGFHTNFPVAHAIVKTGGAYLKYSYWF